MVELSMGGTRANGGSVYGEVIHSAALPSGGFPAGVGDPAAGHDTLPHYVEDGDDQRKERRMITYPDRRPASTSVPYSQTTQTGTAARFVAVPDNKPRMMSSVR